MNTGRQDDALDREFDLALAKCAAVEPRTGLEERILANLRTEHAREPDRLWWRRPAVMAAAAVVVIALGVALRSKLAHPVVANHPIVNHPSVMTTSQQEATRVVSPDTEVRPRPPVAVGRNLRPVSAPVVAAAPKLDVFPSPQPLSEQEKILASYVAQFHKQAVLIARVANQEREHDRLEAMGTSQGLAEHED
jgi:hypothetical protein